MRSRDPPPPITAHLAAEGAGRVDAVGGTGAGGGARAGALVTVHTLLLLVQPGHCNALGQTIGKCNSFKDTILS